MENPKTSEDRQTISSFYNDFKRKQAATGVNLRHYMVFDKSVRAGLKKNHDVLEIGCGIGTFTGLLARFIKGGSILATDISNESVDFARDALKASRNVTFQVSDMTDFSSPKKFDFVVMADVLEHIPFEQYDQLFSVIDEHTHSNSILAMNIPHPDIIRHLRASHPEELQIIDNSVDMDFLSKHIYRHGFRLSGYTPYAIHNTENDYVFMTFEKSGRVKVFRNLSKLKIQAGKLLFRLKFHASLIHPK